MDYRNYIKLHPYITVSAERVIDSVFEKTLGVSKRLNPDLLSSFM